MIRNLRKYSVPRKGIERGGEERYRTDASAKEKNWHWAYTVMLAGLFLGIFSLAFAGGKTLVSFAFLSRLLAFCCLAGLLIPMRLYSRWLGMNKLASFLFNVMGIGPLLCSILLWLNFFITADTRQETHRITQAKLVTAVYFDNAGVVFTLEGDAYKENEEFRRIGITLENAQLIYGKTLRITTAEGLLGYRVLLEIEVAE